jgi:peptidoglycan/xylan/chitin deacetylase (PgdA/CDA1 family)
LKEKFFRNVITNVIIAVVVLGVFGLTYFTVDTQVRANPDGAISKGNDSKKVSLMFDVYQGTEYLDDVLRIFDDYKLSATFFVGGSWVADNEDSLQKISHYGHELGNHGYFNLDHSTLSSNRNREEIVATHRLVKAILNIEMKNFAPPSGVFNKFTIQEANNLNYNTIMWTVDTMDWRDQDANLIYRRATERVSGGEFILFHLTKATVESLPKIIDNLKGRGLGIVPIREVV